MQKKYQIEKELLKHAVSALLRLQTIMPEAAFELIENSFSYNYDNVEQERQIKKTIAHTLYREKLYYETLPIRMMLLETLQR